MAGETVVRAMAEAAMAAATVGETMVVWWW